MMVATFSGNSNSTIITSYSPDNADVETDLITFFNELSSLVRCILKHNVLIIGGEKNARIGKQQILLRQLVKEKWGA